MKLEIIICWLLIILIACTASEVIQVHHSVANSNQLIGSSTKVEKVASRSLSDQTSILPVKETPSPGGFWKTKQEWRAYWVKDWVAKKIYVPIWKHVWGPAEVREWVPTGVAKPHPGLTHNTIIH